MYSATSIEQFVVYKSLIRLGSFDGVIPTILGVHIYLQSLRIDSNDLVIILSLFHVFILVKNWDENEGFVSK